MMQVNKYCLVHKNSFHPAINILYSIAKSHEGKNIFIKVILSGLREQAIQHLKPMRFFTSFTGTVYGNMQTHRTLSKNGMQ